MYQWKTGVKIKFHTKVKIMFSMEASRTRRVVEESLRSSSPDFRQTSRGCPGFPSWSVFRPEEKQNNKWRNWTGADESNWGPTRSDLVGVGLLYQVFSFSLSEAQVGPEEPVHGFLPVQPPVFVFVLFVQEMLTFGFQLLIWNAFIILCVVQVSCSQVIRLQGNQVTLTCEDLNPPPPPHHWFNSNFIHINQTRELLNYQVVKSDVVSYSTIKLHVSNVD